MKKYITLISLLFINVTINATIYYCSTTGTDGAYPTRGTFANPWKTWHYAMNYTTAGDTCYFMGGVYLPYSSSIGVDLLDITNSGTHDNPTCFFAYPSDWAAENYPIMDCATITADPSIGVEISGASHLYFKGLHLKNVFQNAAGVGNANGWVMWSRYSKTSHANIDIKFENCVAHNIGGVGFSLSVVDTCYLINCDAFNCCDTLNNGTSAGGHGSGYQIGNAISAWDNAYNTYIYFYGCRAWNCSDQGFSLGSAGVEIIDHCWSLYNGHYDLTAWMPPSETKGSGFKMWFTSNCDNDNILQFVMRNCIAAYNAFDGINWTSSAQAETRAHLYNNFVYSTVYPVPPSTSGWGYGVYDVMNSDTSGYWDHWWKNNLSYHHNERFDGIAGIGTESSNNLFFVSGSPITDEYFLSLDTTGMMGIHERETYWALPETNFGKPSSTSPLIDAGTDVGLSYSGVAPDIGWDEYSSPYPADTALVASVSSYKPFWLTNTTAQSGGDVYDDGGATVTARGICWNTTGSPTLSDSYTVNGSGTGVFTATMEGLSRSETYYVRAYATNSEGTAYGNQMTFRKSALMKGIKKMFTPGGKLLVID